VTGVPTIDPFLWENGKMTDLGSLGGTNGFPVALNNRGQVIGVSNLAGDQTADPFLWDRGKLIDLYTSTTGGNVITANATNDAGQIVGAADFSSTGGSSFSAVLWRKGVATNLGTLSGDCASQAYAINSRGQVVGDSFSCDTGQVRTFLWENGEMIDINRMIPPGFTLALTNPLTINERGEIGGFGAPAGCADAELCGHAFLLIPDGKDEPANSESATATRETDVVPATQEPAQVAHGKLTPEKLAALRARFAHHIRGFGLKQSK
jgi:probable HAF family extracellular repeat protein